MELKAAIFFVFLYYIRPQDWVAGMEGFNIIRPMILFWGWALYNARQRSPVAGVLKTPHDWIMMAYWAWVVWTAQEAQAALTGFLTLLVFYSFTVHSITSWSRVMLYLKGLNYALLLIALLAVLSLFKIDFVHAIEATEINEGRLCIGTWMHNNPNALGHSVAVVVPLSYLLYFWRGSAMGRFVIFPLQSSLALFCIYETQSKGAFLVTAFLMLMIFVIGRPLIVKIFALALALSMGVSALSFLPRMSEMSSLRADEGVQGRLMAWELAKTSMENSPAGWKQFVAYINWRGLTVKKATHSSYVQLGADLGIEGIFIYLLALWAAFRSTLLLARLGRENEQIERCRRIMAILILACVISNWMINREYHTEYFLLIAIAAAMHRLYQAQDEKSLELDGQQSVGELLNNSESVVLPRALGGRLPTVRSESTAIRLDSLVPPQTVLASGQSAPLSAAGLTTSSAVDGHESTPVGPQERAAFWNRLQVLDLTVAAALTWTVIYIWEYVLKNL